MLTKEEKKIYSIENLPSGKVPYGFTNDYMFHMVFQKSEGALKHLIALITRIPEDSIKSIHIQNVIEPGQSVNDKTCILDIKLQLNNDYVIDLEMQVNNHSDWPERSLLYLCRIYDDLSKGQEYINLKTAIHIGILDFTISGMQQELCSKYLMTNQKTGEVYTSKFQLYVLNLTLASDEDYQVEENEQELMKWVQLFKATTWEQMRAISEGNAYMEDCVVIMHEMTDDERVKMEAEARFRYECDRASLLGQARREGIEQGKILSLQEAILENLKMLGQVPSELEMKILDTSDMDILKKWIRLSVTSKTLEEFAESM